MHEGQDDEGEQVLGGEDDDGEGVLHPGCRPDLNTQRILRPGQRHQLYLLRQSTRSQLKHFIISISLKNVLTWNNNIGDVNMKASSQITAAIVPTFL